MRDQPVLHQDGELTYGELRRRLEQMSEPWSVDPTISDDELVPQFPTGGQSEEEPEIHAAATIIQPGTDIRELISELPPNDPDLVQRWVEEGIPLDHEVAQGTSDRPPSRTTDKGDRRPGQGEQ